MTKNNFAPATLGSCVFTKDAAMILLKWFS